MLNLPELLLVLGTVGVGVLHTMVPDHWLPIALLAKQRGWSRGEVARAAFQAGFGHVMTTVVLGVAVWLVGLTAAKTLGHWVDVAASLALIAFGAWIAAGAWRDLQGGGAHEHTHSHGHVHHHGHDHAHGNDHHSHLDLRPWDRDPYYSPGAATVERHSHVHRHGNGAPHFHWHDHAAFDSHPMSAAISLTPPLHFHAHRTSGRTALLLVLGSSPMVEGIPAFFAAARYGIGLLVLLGIAFAVSTIATYVVLSVYFAEGLRRVSLGPLERYGEVASGLLIAAVGVAFGALLTFGA